VVLIGLTFVLVACSGGSQSEVPFVDLSQREALPVAAVSSVAPLHVAVAAVLSPEGTIDSYAGFVDYLGERLNRPVELVQRRTYAEVNALIASGEVDLAFVCTSAYVAGSDRSEMELLAIPEINGERVYHSALIVPSDSTATGIADLEGKVFAFTDPMSNTGRVYPTFLVRELGATPDSFFSDSFFTYSHDRAIAAVADGLADGAAVDSLVLDYAVARDPALATRLKVIHRSPDFGIPPVVVPIGMSPNLRAELLELLLDLDDDPAGSSVLVDLGVDRFVRGDDGAYDGVRELVAATEMTG
jgi:phosphonate transport system substrate-binding protein